MQALTGSENEHDSYLCQSTKTLSGSASRYPNRSLSAPRLQLHRTQHAYIWQEKPNDRSGRLHYDSYEDIHIHSDFTPQAVGNSTLRD